MKEKLYGSLGTPEDKTRCFESVGDNFWPMTRQCFRKRGYGEDGLYCKQHARDHNAD